MVVVCPKHIVNVQPAAQRNIASAESLLEVLVWNFKHLLYIDGYRWISMSMDIKRIDMMYLTLFKYIYIYAPGPATPPLPPPRMGWVPYWDLPPPPLWCGGGVVLSPSPPVVWWGCGMVCWVCMVCMVGLVWHVWKVWMYGRYGMYGTYVCYCMYGRCGNYVAYVWYMWYVW